MASRRDLLQSFQFAARRVVSAVVLRQTDPREWPFRRLGGAGLATVMLTVVALGAVGVYGMIVPGGKTSWRDGRTIIVEKGTGASYIFRDGVLHPVYNFASAALLVGTTAVTRTAASSLADVPHGVEVGIPGAPATLPGPDDVVAPPWALCTEQVPDQSGTMTSRTRLVVGRSPGQGRPAGDSALLVTDTADQQQYIVWRDTRYLVTDLRVVGVAMRLSEQVNVPVGDAWLKALPAGQPIGPITSRTSGPPSTAVPGVPTAVVGEVFKVTNDDGGLTYYLTEGKTLVSISELQALIQQAYGAKISKLSPSAAAAAGPAPAAAATASSPPVSVPPFVRPQSSDTILCAAYQDGSFTPEVLVDSEIPAGAGIATTGVGALGEPLADRVWLDPGKAALVESMPSPKASTGPLYLVTDTGWRFAVPSQEVQRMIGLGTAEVSRLPSSLLVRIPEGPPLSPEKALQALTIDTSGS